MIKQSFVLVPHGLLEDGNAEFKIDETSGDVTLTGNVEAGIGPFSKDVPLSANLKINPAFLFSKNLEVGMSIKMGDVTVALTSKTSARIIYAQNEDNNLSGTAAVDLTGQYIKLGAINLNGKLQGYVVQIELQPQP